MTKPVEFDDLFRSLGEMRAKVSQDPAFMGAVAQWPECLADKGYHDNHELGDLSKKLQAEWDAQRGVATVVVTVGQEEATTAQPPSSPSAAPISVEEFRAKEIAAALADFDCRQGLTTIRNELAMKLETEFVEHHRQQLERYRDWVQSAGKPK